MMMKDTMIYIIGYIYTYVWYMYIYDAAQSANYPHLPFISPFKARDKVAYVIPVRTRLYSRRAHMYA